MPFIKSSASKRRAYIVAVILLLSKIMPICSCCMLKGLVYIVIIALLGRQPSSCTKCTKLNMYLFYDIKSVFITKYICLICFCILQSLQLSYLICLRVSYNSYYRETQL